jgi:hypothetical protein
MHHLGFVALSASQLDTAARWFAAAADARRETYGENNAQYALSVSRLGGVRRRGTTPGPAVGATRLPPPFPDGAGSPPGHIDIVVAETELGAAIAMAGRPREAERLLLRLRSRVQAAGAASLHAPARDARLRLAELDTLIASVRRQRASAR